MHLRFAPKKPNLFRRGPGGAKLLSFEPTIKKFNGKVIDSTAELENAGTPIIHHRYEHQIKDVEEATRRLRLEQQEFATDPKVR